MTGWAGASRCERLAALPLHPMLFAAYPTLFYFAANHDRLALGELRQPLFWSAILALGISIGLSILLSDARRAALLVSLGLGAVFLYGALLSTARRLYGAPFAERWFFVPYVLGVVAAGLLFGRRRADLMHVTVVANAAALLLVSLNMTSVVHRAVSESKRGPAALPAEIASEPSAFLPSIYYLILDGHAGERTLRERLGVTGATLPGDLRKRGFLVDDLAIANYSNTFLSLACSLNMRYVDEFEASEQRWHLLNEDIANNEVLRFLADHGYRTIHVRSGKGITNENPYADITFQAGRFTELTTLVLDNSLLAPILRRTLLDDHRAIVLRALDRLQTIGDITGPKFVFAHLLIPHPPFVFAADGTTMEAGAKTVSAYLAQVDFVRRRIGGVVDAILARPEPTIVIVQSDHGPASAVAWETASADFNPGNTALVDERMRILFAVYLPDRDPHDVFPPGGSPVNLFRRLFSTYFAADLPPLEDRSFFSTYAEPFRFVDVTSVVHPTSTAELREASQ